MTPADFKREYMADFVTNEPPLWDLARRYYVETERFDRTVCSGGPIGRDGILPMNGWQASECNRNAQKLLEELTNEAKRRGNTAAELRDTMRDFVKSGDFKKAMTEVHR